MCSPALTFTPKTTWASFTSLASKSCSNAIYETACKEQAQQEGNKAYAPFRDGGTALVRYHKIEGLKAFDNSHIPTQADVDTDYSAGAKQFDPVYAIPDNWATFVLPAFNFQQSHKALFDETKVVANAKQLTALLDDANPFNAVAAARLLAPQRGLGVPFVLSTLANSSGYTQAIFTYFVFKNAHPIRQAAIDDVLVQVIDKAPTSETLKWISLGVTTAQNDDGQSWFLLKNRVKALLLRVAQRQKTLGTKTPDDDYVNELLINAQIRTEPAFIPPTSTK